MLCKSQAEKKGLTEIDLLLISSFHKFKEVQGFKNGVKTLSFR